jgi:predicted ATPase
MAAPGARRRVPAPLSRFYGRADETRTVRALLDDSRLVTLVGSPGSGKTRLSTEIGAELHDRFRDGFLLRGSDIGPGRRVGARRPRVGAGHRGAAGFAVADTVVEALATVELLVILDNCEHLVRAAATMAGSLLHGCGDIRVLATSRIALSITGEQLFRVPPLDLDPSVALFADRARLVRPTITIDDDDHHDIERICRRMDGLPLAIELAAAWSRVVLFDQLSLFIAHRRRTGVARRGGQGDRLLRRRDL